MEEAELTDLAKRFAAAIPEDELSVSEATVWGLHSWLTQSVQVAAVQGYLLKNKSRPKEAVDEVGEW